MQILFILSGAGLPIAIQRYFAERDGPVSAARLLGLSLVIAVLFGVATGATAPYWAEGLGFGDSGALVPLAAAWGGLGTMTGSSLALLRSQDRIGAYAVVGLFQ